MNQTKQTQIIEINPYKYLIGCIGLGLIILMIGANSSLPSWLVAAEVLATVIALFVFGSIRYRLNKNILTYGAVIPITATFFVRWWASSGLRLSIQTAGVQAGIDFIANHFLSFQGLETLIHLDTLLFILGLTYFIAAIAQTRILETVSFAILRKNKGNVFSTIAFLLALVALCSGVMDGVSMIGLLIRTMVIILTLSKVDDEEIIYFVMVSTVITTVCGIWLAYGEPPNLIMKNNLFPYLDNMFFIRYCLPPAVGSYFLVLWNIRRKFKTTKIEIDKLDLIDSHAADVRFYQSARHGEVLTYIEFIHDHKDLLGEYFTPVLTHIHEGIPLGESLIRANIAPEKRIKLLGIFFSEELAGTLDEHYRHRVQKNHSDADDAAIKITQILEKTIRPDRLRAQKIALFAFIPFIGLLIGHSFNHHLPLFIASFAGFGVAFYGIFDKPKMRGLFLREAWHEFSEYLFLIPLFFSITLVQKTGFFDQLGHFLHWGIKVFGTAHVAFGQLAGSTFLSAILDNNVVADFASRMLNGLSINSLHLFALAQITGYALGGCATHIGSAQSVVAYSFIRKEISENFTPLQWIKRMLPLILEIFIMIAVIIYVRGWLFDG